MIVVKMGGSILREGVSPGLVSDIKNVLSGDKIVLVHGGGIEVTEIASKLGKEQRFVVSPDGFRSRYTDRDTIEIYSMVMAGRINKKIVSALLSEGIPALGLSGLDGLLLQAERKKRLIVVDENGRKRVVDGGYTGRIKRVNLNLLELLVKNGYVPVITPVAIGEEFEALNVDGDRAAACIAGGLGADRLLFLTDVEGLILNGRLVPIISVSDLKDVLQKIGPGMITKIHAAMEALNLGVNEVLISSGQGKSSISSPLKHECGTVIKRE
ncbi:MAG: [LysW]-aminoadipate/[LysW]-glutamate kinase [Candidatus Bathycorpusculaceae bacterium]